MKAPKEIIKKLQWWLKKWFEKEFSDSGDQLEHGLQDDGISCGIVVANTTAHDIFNDKLWMAEHKAVERVQWFMMLSKKHMEDICFVPDSRIITELLYQINQHAMDVAPYPLVGRSVEMVETEATSGNCTLISHLLNPVQDSEIATLLRHEGNSRNGILSSKSDSALDDNMDLQERNSHKDTTLPKPCRDD